MKIRSLFLVLTALCMSVLTSGAVNLTVKMNRTSKTMKMVSKATGETIVTGEPDNMVYNFQTTPGDYIITGYDGTTENGTIEVAVGDSVSQQITVLTLTAYVSNKTDGRTWTVDDGDYTLDVRTNSREGVNHPITVGNSTTAGRKTFLALNGDSYYASFIPSEAHAAEGYTTLYKSNTLTGNINVNGAIPLAHDFSITVPKNAEFELNMKFSHFVDFTPVPPVSTDESGDAKVITYRLAESQVYNYRTYMEGGLTQGGYFTMNKDEAKRPVLVFTDADYHAFGPKQINHSVKADGGYETGDIFVNINPKGYLRLDTGDVFKAHAMRSWQLTDNSTNNYFIEPDFHYTILDLDGNVSSDVLQVKQKTGSAWADLKAVGNGTAIVLVTYDAIGLNYYNSSGAKTAYMGGEYWGAIWPENTAVYVVTVGQPESAVVPEITVNKEYNTAAQKLAGENVDAEHDVFYYLDTEEGHIYTFKATGAATMTIAYPTIGEQTATYTGFTSDGITDNGDGTYSVLLKEGRQILKMTDASGNSTYQIFTAKKCHREIVNVNRPGSKIFQPGDQVAIQYTGLRHPANKLAGIYNMSAYVTYNGVPNGTSLILSGNQYTFGSSDKAQTVSLDIPADHDITAEPTINFTEGVIQVNGYGDPIGNHRNISPIAGRSPNFTAIPHKTYFGYIPDVTINLTPVKMFDIKVTYDVPDAEVTVTHLGQQLEPGEEGLYEGSYGIYSVVASAPGYRCLRLDYNIADDAEGLQTFNILPEPIDGDWYGTNSKQPVENEEGYYIISTPAELAWFRDKVNEGETAIKGIVTNDLDLGDYAWTPIGATTSKPFGGELLGDGHSIKGLYINNPSDNYQGLFGCVKGTEEVHAKISGITVHGQVSGKQTVAGLVAYLTDYTDISTCANYASVRGTKAGVGGIAGSMTKTTSTIRDCYNAGDIFCASNHAGIVGNLSNGCEAGISNVFNVGEIEDLGNTAGAIVSYNTNVTVNPIANAFAVKEYNRPGCYTLVSEETMASGEIAYKLGEAFGQKIGTDAHPVFGGEKVYYNADTDTYYNENIGTGLEEILNGDATPELFYNIEGIPSAKPWQGFNLVKMSDGTTRKVFIK